MTRFYDVLPTPDDGDDASRQFGRECVQSFDYFVQFSNVIQGRTVEEIAELVVSMLTKEYGRCDVRIPAAMDALVEHIRSRAPEIKDGTHK